MARKAKQQMIMIDTLRGFLFSFQCGVLFGLLVLCLIFFLCSNHLPVAIIIIVWCVMNICGLCGLACLLLQFFNQTSKFVVCIYFWC